MPLSAPIPRRFSCGSAARRARRRPARRAQDSSPVRQHWENGGPASAPERGGRTPAAVLLTPPSGAGKLIPPATHGGAPWATFLRPSGSARCGAGGKFRGIGGADPLVRAGPPGPALGGPNRRLLASIWPARGPAADGGVRPTIYADGQNCLPHA